MTRTGAGLPPRPPSGNGEDDDTAGGSAALQMPSVSWTGARVLSSGSASASASPLAAVAEGTPLLHQHGSAAAGQDDFDAGSVSSRTSIGSVSAPYAPSWLLTALSNRILPGDTEVVDDGNTSCAVSIGSIGSDEYLMNEAVRIKAREDQQVSAVSNGQKHHYHHHHHHKGKRVQRSLRRRIFLLLTEPQTSIASFIFFIILILAIALSNILMMMQTMRSFQFKPDDCVICGGTNDYYSSNDDTVYTGPSLQDLQNLSIECECPPVPLPWTIWLEDGTIWFFTVEWTLRVLCFEPAVSAAASVADYSVRISFKQKLSYLMEWTTILDALAIFPYYIERYEKTNGLLSLRLLRLFRVFQLLRLGKYNTTFLSLMNVLVESILSFNILLIVLVFGAAFFGSMIYWMEKGVWKYTTYTDPPTFAFMRIGADGVSEEPSPFTSIPASFWWFIVTATTVGFGDTYPTSLGGKCVAGLAMLMGVLVIAFPVSVFSDLWSKELKKAGVLEKLVSDLDADTGGSAREDNQNTTDFPVQQQQHSSSDDTLLMRADDLNVIKLHLKRIDESQDEIRRILENYE